jgi:transposase
MSEPTMSTIRRLTGTRHNRRERRKLERQLKKLDPGLSIVHPDAGGIDVGNESHFVAVPPDRDENPVREFGSWTADLIRMATWLKQCRISTVAIQATGVYWIAMYDILTQQGIRVVVVNAQHTRNVPGRKSDVQESQWLMKLHTYGLLRDSFHLPSAMERVRTIWRLRDRHVKEASEAIQHMQKALTKMNVQLSNVLSDISGVSGQAIIAAILKGERDANKLADLLTKGVKASREEVVRSLEGNWREDVIFELHQAVTAYRFAHRQMVECDQQLCLYLSELPERRIQTGDQEVEAEPVKGKRRKRVHGNAPTIFDLQAELKRIAGVDLTSIDGIHVMTAQTILSEVGPDLSDFPDEKHFCSWLGLTPGQEASGGKVKKGRRKVNNRVAQALRIAASTLVKSMSYLGARFRTLVRTLGCKPAAIKAMARYLAVLVYRLLTRGHVWVDRGAEMFENRRKEKELARLEKTAAARGLKLVPITQ